MGHRSQSQIRSRNGFALPTILIASIVMVIVMLAAIQSAVSVRVALDNQYYSKLAQEAGQAGVAYAKACFATNAGKPDPVWTANQSRTLATGDGCDGAPIVGAPQYVLNANGIRTSFKVSYPTVDSSGVAANVPSVGTVELLRSSNGLPWHSQSQTYTANVTELFIDDSFPLATSVEGYWSAPPTGYLIENGAAVSRTLYANLFAAIGTTYGAGNGSTTFNLPDSRGRVGVNKKATDTEFDTMGEQYGEKAHTLTIAEMPAHSHQQYVNANTGGTPAFRRDWDADISGLAAYDQGITTGSAGGGGAHNEIQPSIVKQAVIKYVVPPSSVSIIPAGTSIQGYWKDATAITTYAPGFVQEDGSSYATATYPALFSVIGYTYGGAGASFNVPNSQGRASVNKNPSDTEFDTVGEQYGTKTETLSLPQLPVHTHEMMMKYANAGGFGIRNDWNDNIVPLTGYTQGVTTGSTGGGGAHNNIQPSIVKMSLIKVTAAATSPDFTVKAGTSLSGYWPNEASIPAGYLLEDGSAVSRTTYADLFAVIGTTHGAGDGSTTFNVPDSRGQVSVNKSSTDTEFDSIGEKYGEKTHILTIAEMPAHTHEQYVTANSGGSGTRKDWTSDTVGLVTNTGQQSGSAGGGLAHNNIQPSIVKIYAIKY
jgi:microcystin-dependent protein/Tfp pilus assembly protein PilV